MISSKGYHQEEIVPSAPTGSCGSIPMVDDSGSCNPIQLQQRRQPLSGMIGRTKGTGRKELNDINSNMYRLRKRIRRLYPCITLFSFFVCGVNYVFIRSVIWPHQYSNLFIWLTRKSPSFLGRSIQQWEWSGMLCGFYLLRIERS